MAMFVKVNNKIDLLQTNCEDKNRIQMTQSPASFIIAELVSVLQGMNFNSTTTNNVVTLKISSSSPLEWFLLLPPLPFRGFCVVSLLLEKVSPPRFFAEVCGWPFVIVSADNLFVLPSSLAEVLRYVLCCLVSVLLSVPANSLDLFRNCPLLLGSFTRAPTSATFWWLADVDVDLISASPGVNSVVVVLLVSPILGISDGERSDKAKELLDTSGSLLL